MIIHEDAPKAKSLFLYSRTNLDFGDETVPTAGSLLSLEDNAPDGNMNVYLGAPRGSGRHEDWHDPAGGRV